MTALPLVILDLDGTLVDSRGLITRIMHTAAKASGLQPPQESDIAGTIGLALPLIMERLFPDLPAERQHGMVEAYRTEALRLRAAGEDAETLYPGIPEVLRTFRDTGFVLGIATGKARRGVDHFCQKFGFEGWFDTVQTPDTNPSKPHPGMIDAALRHTGALSHQTVMVGDTTFDMEMAENAGVTGIGVTWGNHPTAALERAGARHIVGTADDLAEVVGQVIREGTQP